MLDIQKIIKDRARENVALHQNINPQFAKVLKTIGFDKSYVKALGVSLFDADNIEYYDFLAGYGVFGLGRNHPKMKKLFRDFLDLDTPSLVQMDAPLLSGLLAERLVQIFGHNIRDTVYFTNSGTESIESAIKFVRGATGRERIINLEHAFHGLTTGSLSVNGNAEFKDGFGTLLPSDTLPLNNLNLLEEKLKTKQYAAFIFEPVQGKGVFVPDQTFLQNAITLCKKYGTLTIADEVQSGLGRTGKWLACEHFDIEPDIVCLSKALSGGICPVGAVVYKREIYNKVFSRMDRCVVHSSTFGQNDYAMFCGLAALSILEEEQLIQNAAKMGKSLLAKLNALKEKHDWIKEVRGKGLMIGIEFQKPSGIKKKIAWELVHKMDKGLFGELIVMSLLSRHRILTQVSGHHQDIVKMLPPFIINETHVNHFVESLDDVLTNCDKVTGPIFTMGKNLARHIVNQNT
ncbi:MAG: aspartate aminotransferase family protein [Deltaproteobacteria bacterium]|nr:aspartate aminotransferase family protein [Deltaproteobacteria bacterium]